MFKSVIITSYHHIIHHSHYWFYLWLIPFNLANYIIIVTWQWALPIRSSSKPTTKNSSSTSSTKPHSKSFPSTARPTSPPTESKIWPQNCSNWPRNAKKCSSKNQRSTTSSKNKNRWYSSEISSPASHQAPTNRKDFEWEPYSKVIIISLRKERVDSWIFGEEERDLSLEDEHQHKERTNNKIVRRHQGRRGDPQGPQTLFRERCLVYA
jgi:DNA mismatch repair ATPase MutL